MFITTMAGLGSVLGIAGGINSLTGGGITSALGFGQSSPSGAEAQKMADPFSDYRGQLGAMYSGALQPGAKANIQDMPGYSQFNTGVMQPAMQAQQRTAAAGGQLYSGGEQQALQKTGQQGYYGFMSDYMNRLAQGSGAAQNPAQAAGMGLAQGQQNQANQMAGFGALQQQFAPGGGISNMFGGNLGGAGGSGLSAGQMSGLQTDAMNQMSTGLVW